MSGPLPDMTAIRIFLSPGPPAMAGETKEKFTTETLRAQRAKAGVPRKFNRSAQRSRRQISFLGGLADWVFVAFVIFCENGWANRGFRGFIGGWVGLGA